MAVKRFIGLEISLETEELSSVEFSDVRRKRAVGNVDWLSQMRG